jgi:virulence-associated protein VapD
MCDIRYELTERIFTNGYTEDCYISHDDVTAAMSQLKFNKNDGGTGLSTKFQTWQ